MSGLMKLTSLADAARAQAAEAGLPPRMKRADILPDPDNPRAPFDERSPEKQRKQQELNADVAARGVKNPISLRPHPTIPGKWIINAGHCRYEAAGVAGHEDIPFFIDRDFNSFDQVNENELHSGLTPWELATFIHKKVIEGMSKGDIAAGLHKKSQNIVTEYLALIDPPACVVAAYAAGVESPRTLYDLRKARDEFPEQLDAWCSSGAQVTRGTIKALLDTLRRPQRATEIQHPAAMHAVPQSTLVSQHLPLYDQSTPAAVDVSEDEASILAESAQAVREGAERAAARAASGHESMAAVPEFRHDEKPAPTIEPPARKNPEFRHDEKQSPANARDTVAPLPVKAKNGNGRIAVQYMGKAATLESDTVVSIVLEGHDAPVKVKVSELVFRGR